MNVLSIQSSVVYGHAGNAAAVFPLQRLGINVWPVMTVQLSNHTGYATARGEALDSDHVAEVIRGIDERGAFADCDAVLSGYLGDAATGAVVLDTVAAVKRANPGAVYACDPVMGDSGPGFYVPPEVAAFLKERAAPLADILLPNQFELAEITGVEISTLEDVLDAAHACLAGGPRIVVVTSVEREGTPAGTIEVVAADSVTAWLIATPRLPGVLGGVGDAFAALFLAHHLRGANLETALEGAVSSIFAALEASAEANAKELALVAAQDAIVDPARRFVTDRIA